VIKKQFIAFGFILSTFLSFSQLKFDSVDSLLKFAENKSTGIKVGDQQSLLAKWTKIAALGNSINLRSPISFASTDNILLPVNFIPGEIFGGPAGSFREITFGQRYVSNFNFNPQIDIINPYAWAKVKSASVNKELTEVNNLITKKNLFESIAAAYYNIVSLQEQVRSSEQNLRNADSLVIIVKNKAGQGLVREQDVNNATINLMGVEDRLNQLKLSLEQQYLSLKVLCDIPASTSVVILADPYKLKTEATKSASSLNLRYSELQSKLAKSELRANRWSMFPVLSLFYYQGYQQNSNTALFDANAKWIESKYIGFRISVPFPPDVSKLSNSYNSKINYRISKMNSEHMALQNAMNNENLNLDQQKALSAYETSSKIYDLKKSNYQKSLNQYREGILPTDILLTNFNDLLIAEINYTSAKAQLGFSTTKLSINNSVK
jgi:outer membrane protein TolC